MRRIHDTTGNSIATAGVTTSASEGYRGSSAAIAPAPAAAAAATPLSNYNIDEVDGAGSSRGNEAGANTSDGKAAGTGHEV